MRTSTAPWRVDEPTRLPDGGRCEIDRGAWILMAAAGRVHARITAAITRHVGTFVHGPSTGTRTLTDPADLAQDAVLPGFTCRLGDFWE